MKYFAIAFCLIGCALASDQVFQVLRNDYVQSPDSYNYVYETQNGISGQAEGKLKVFEKDSAAVVVSGANKWTDKDGNKFDVTYVANEKGYQPQGAHLPTPPPVPEYIARAIAYIAAHN